jgi:hypothetical protein
MIEFTLTLLKVILDPKSTQTPTDADTNMTFHPDPGATAVTADRFFFCQTRPQPARCIPVTEDSSPREEGRRRKTIGTQNPNPTATPPRPTVATASPADAAGMVPAGPPVHLEATVMAAVKASEARGDPPLLRAVDLARAVAGECATVPSADLAGILVSNLCFAHNSPSLWKLVGQAMASRLVSPLHVLALLTPRCACLFLRRWNSIGTRLTDLSLLVDSRRVLPQRQAQPEAYRLYLELMRCNVTSSLSMEAGPYRDK